MWLDSVLHAYTLLILRNVKAKLLTYLRKLFGEKR